MAGLPPSIALGDITSTVAILSTCPKALIALQMYVPLSDSVTSGKIDQGVNT